MRRKTMIGIWIFLSAVVSAVVTVIIFSALRIAEEKQSDEKIRTLEVMYETSEKYNVELLSANVRLSEQLESEKSKTAQLENRLAIISLRNAEKTEPQEQPEVSVLPWGDIHTNMYRCEDYRKITNLSSYQFRLVSQCRASDSTGIMTYIDSDGEYYFCAALGGYFGHQIGDAWKFTMNNGSFFNVILADFKHPIEQDKPETDYGDEDYNYLGDKCLNVIEFVIDGETAPKKVLKAGTMSALEVFGGLYGYGGDIAEIEYLGRKWKP